MIQAATEADLGGFYRNKHVLVTGGMGNIGSNLAIALVRLGARVTVIDSHVPGCGANEHNLDSVDGGYSRWDADIATAADYPCVLESLDLVFNLAGEVSHVHSMLFPCRDLAINVESQICFLQALVRHAPGRRVVYASTRQVYGRPQYLPVDERHPVEPPDFNGIHKHATDNYHRLLATLGQLDCIVLRLTNVLGPRMAIGLPCQGFLGDFTRRALSRDPLVVFGDGKQLRDPIYVDDAVDAFLRAGAVTVPRRRVLNVGSGVALSVADIAREFCLASELPPLELRPFPVHRQAIDVGGFLTNPVACEEALGWSAKTSFPDALRATLDYYRANRRHYLPDDSQAACPLNHLTS